MHQTKRVLSILLALLLGLTTLSSAAMASDTIDPNAPIITKPPSATVKGNSIALEVSARLPDGATGELSYLWYRYYNMFSSTPVAAGASATVDVFRKPITDYRNFDQILNHLLVYPTYYVEITNTYEDGDGNTKTSTIRSDGIQVMIAMSLTDAISEFWEYGSEGRTNTAAGVFFMMVTLPILLPAYVWSRISFVSISIMSLFR
jgi:hypothetical protein